MGDLCGWGLLRQYYIYTPQLIKKERKKKREKEGRRILDQYIYNVPSFSTAPAQTLSTQFE